MSEKNLTVEVNRVVYLIKDKISYNRKFTYAHQGDPLKILATLDKQYRVEGANGRFHVLHEEVISEPVVDEVVEIIKEAKDQLSLF